MKPWVLFATAGACMAATIGFAAAAAYDEGRDRAPIEVVGPPGPQGEPGRDGVDGESIVGPPGPAGRDGVDGESIVGPQGDASDVPGPAGEAGASIVGPAGESIVGPQGETGAPSNVPGPQGVPGETVVGPQGEPGPRGIPGEPGPTCPVGFKEQVLTVEVKILGEPIEVPAVLCVAD